MKTRIKWHRLLTNPATRMESQAGDVTQLKVDGLVCSTICALRTKEALEALDGVRSVRVDFDSGIATIEGEAHDPAEYERVVTGAVAGKPVRRFIEHVDRLVRPARAAAHVADDVVGAKDSHS